MLSKGLFGALLFVFVDVSVLGCVVEFLVPTKQPILIPLFVTHPTVGLFSCHPAALSGQFTFGSGLVVRIWGFPPGIVTTHLS